nr:hypothetical protein [Pseudomonas sp. Hg5Tf]MDH2562213.1 hypothetical protein [Pseudomonas sp. Hg5Tf]
MMTTIKKLGLAVAVSMAIAGQAQATGVPTGDAGTWAGLAQNLAVLQQQYQTLKDQYETQGNILNNLQGTYGRGAIGLNESINSASVVPGSWQSGIPPELGRLWQQAELLRATDQHAAAGAVRRSRQQPRKGLPVEF